MSAEVREDRFTGAANVPDSATFPRLMTAQHPLAVGSYGPSAREWSLERPGLHMRPIKSLRWWQDLALTRALEHDAEGKLVWQTVLVSAPRQVGKSYLERIVCAWRMHHAELFGEPQDVMHVAHKTGAAVEVWRPAARWHMGQYGVRSVRNTNGEQRIELPDGSRWLIQAATDGAGVAFSLSMVLVDEAWRVPRFVVDGALGPTMAEAEQPQLWLVSTAGTSQSDLMHAYRALALAFLEPERTDTTLILEWSAPPDPDLDIDDPAVWRSASPYWDERRAARVAKARGETSETAFRQQWLNQWVPTVTAPLFDAGTLAALSWPRALPDGPLAFGVDVAADRSHAAILALAGGVAELVEHRPGASWVAGRLAELVAAWEPCAVGLDGTGPAASVADQLAGTAAGDLLVVLTGRELATACGLVFDAITDGAVLMVPNEHLTKALESAHKRPYGQSWAFARQSGESSGVAILALTAAMWAASHAPAQVEKSAIW